MTDAHPQFDVFLSHSHEDAAWVESLATRLEDERSFRVWLDKWILVPGKSWQQAMARGLEEAQTCAVCVGSNTPDGWFRQEIERALDRQTQDESFRVIPVLLPDASKEYVPGFLSLRTWADFRKGNDEAYAFHVLAQGIRGEPIGRWPQHKNTDMARDLSLHERRLQELHQFRTIGIHEEVAMEFERKILTKWLEDQE